MNTYKTFAFGMAISLAAALAGCQSETGSTDVEDISSAARLRVNIIGGGHATRSIVEGDMLPYESYYTIHAMAGNSTNTIPFGFGVPVWYNDGTSRLLEEVPIMRGYDVPVFAIYPKSDGSATETYIDGRKCIDYMWGKSIDEEGNLAYANAENPWVNLKFSHMMSRITIRIKKDAENPDSYKFTSLSLGGDSENAYRYGYANLMTQEIFEKRYGEREQIEGLWGQDGSNYYIDGSEDVVTVDFTVIPSETVWDFTMVYNFNDTKRTTSLPLTSYESGQQYIFNCTISKHEEAYLEITSVEIRPWDTQEMPELKVE